MLARLRVCSALARYQDSIANNIAGHPAETSSRASESSKPTEPASPKAGDEKSEKKISQLKDKLKNKLHIGSKDK
jgi:hypothetical protein